MTFHFDTSGAITVRAGLNQPMDMRWPDLSPFVQGMIAGMLREAHLRDRMNGALAPMTTLENLTPELPRFSDISPSALARLIKDGVLAVDMGAPNTTEAGERHWRIQQSNGAPPFGPKRISFNEGKIELTEAE